MSLDKIKESNKLYHIGADEVGYGSWAGPVVVCAVKAPKDWSLEGLNDSKQLTEKKRYEMRDKLSLLIEKGEIASAMAERSNSKIDTCGLGHAVQSCFIELFKKLHCPDSLLIADGNFNFAKHLGSGYDGVALPKADALIPSVMAASILAKTYRDDLMKRLHNQHPEYGWISNVGYHSVGHKAALNQHGVTPYHRISYKPIREIAKRHASLSYRIQKEMDEEVLKDMNQFLDHLPDETNN